MSDVLVAGFGNVAAGDDAFGVEVVRRMTSRPVPEGIRVVDYGMRAFDLAFALQDERNATILVDALRRGGEPGELYLFEPAPVAGDELETLDAPMPATRTANMDPGTLLRLTQALGRARSRVVVLGCEPATTQGDDGRARMTAAVEAAVPRAIEMVLWLAARLRADPEGVLAVSASANPNIRATRPASGSGLGET